VLAANKITIGVGVSLQMKLMEMREMLHHHHHHNHNRFGDHIDYPSVVCMCMCVLCDLVIRDEEEGGGFMGDGQWEGYEPHLYSDILGCDLDEGMQFVRFLPSFMSTMVETSSSSDSEMGSEASWSGRRGGGGSGGGDGSPFPSSSLVSNRRDDIL